MQLAEDELYNWYWCGKKLVTEAGGTSTQAVLVPADIKRWSVVKDPEFIEYMLAIGFVESRYSDRALSFMDAHGMFQLTLDGASDGATECGLSQPDGWKSLTLLHQRKTNVKYASCLLRKYLRETHGSWLEALILYNGGYRQLTRFETTGTMVPETLNYVVQVLHTKEKCNVPRFPN